MSTYLATLAVVVFEAVVDSEHGDVARVLMKRHGDLELATGRRRAHLQTAVLRLSQDTCARSFLRRGDMVWRAGHGGGNLVDDHDRTHGGRHAPRLPR